MTMEIHHDLCNEKLCIDTEQSGESIQRGNNRARSQS